VSRSTPSAPEPALDAATAALLAGAERLEKRALARLVSLVEREDAAARDQRRALFGRLAATPPGGRVVGVTGTPGAGKSSLIGRLALHLVETDPAVRIAILAIDPTSLDSGGALLGDRLRTRFPVGERRVFFRSQATQGDLGGVGRRTWAATRLLRHLVDMILVETVGIGQSEIEIARLADATALVLQPLAGDHVQFMKAGVMDIPDLYVVNKCDEEALARRSTYELAAALKVARIGGDEPRIFQTSATTGRGVPELAAYLRALPQRPPDPMHFVRRAVAEAYGRFGLAIVERAAATWDGRGAAYEELEARAFDAVRRELDRSR
jgi:LAO/AO transport system kinase